MSGDTQEKVWQQYRRSVRTALEYAACMVVLMAYMAAFIVWMLAPGIVAVYWMETGWDITVRLALLVGLGAAIWLFFIATPVAMIVASKLPEPAEMFDNVQ